MARMTYLWGLLAKSLLLERERAAKPGCGLLECQLAFVSALATWGTETCPVFLSRPLGGARLLEIAAGGAACSGPPQRLGLTCGRWSQVGWGGVDSPLLPQLVEDY